MVWIKMRAKWNSNRIWNVLENVLVKWAQECDYYCIVQLSHNILQYNVTLNMVEQKTKAKRRSDFK